MAAPMMKKDVEPTHISNWFEYPAWGKDASREDESALTAYGGVQLTFIVKRHEMVSPWI